MLRNIFYNHDTGLSTNWTPIFVKNNKALLREYNVITPRHNYFNVLQNGIICLRTYVKNSLITLKNEVKSHRGRTAS